MLCVVLVTLILGVTGENDVITVGLMTESLTSPPETCPFTHTLENNGCPSWMECEHGVCVEVPVSGDHTGVQYKCDCDPMWMLGDCSKCCPLKCKNNGTCLFNREDDMPFCNCLLPYKGELCEPLGK